MDYNGFWRYKCVVWLVVMQKGRYLLEENVWFDCGMYMNEYDLKLPDILEDEEIVQIVDEIIVRIME